MRIKSWVVPFAFLILAGLIISRFSYADDYQSNRSTNAVSASTVIRIPNTDPGDILSKIIVGSRSAGAETLTVYDSSGSANNVIGIIDLSTSTYNTFNEYDYNHKVSSGVTITKSGASASVIILWKNVR